MIEPKNLRDWLFRGLMFEAEADRFRAAGIRVGADTEDAERALFAETLAPFGVDLRGEAMRMARVYSLLYCFENSVRALITERLRERYGDQWWTEKAPKKVREFAAGRQKDAQENSWLEGYSKDVLGFVQFGHLADIIVENWDDFSDLVPSQHWLKQRLDELERARNFIAHSGIPKPNTNANFEYYIIPASVMAKSVVDAYQLWLRSPGVKGQAHKDNSVRTVHLPPYKSSYSKLDISKYRDRWDLIEQKLRA